jgi:hypothetical protein
MRVVVVALCLGGCLTPFDEALICVGVEDGAACGDGTCREGSCCHGCWDGATCHAGDLDTVCGGGGAVCVQCRAPTDVCAENACGPSRRAVDLGVGGTVSCAVDDGGALWCWGSNAFGGRGTGPDGPADTGTPMRVGAERTWVRVDAGEIGTPHACAIDDLATLHCWGYNGHGELGSGGVDSDVPLEVVEPGPWTDVACGIAATCGIKDGGRLFCWGWNGGNRVGFMSPTPTRPVSFPTEQRFARVSMHDGHTCALGADRSLSCWGENGAGQLGHQGTDAAIVAPGSTWRSISTGSEHTCGVQTDGTLWCWAATSSARSGDRRRRCRSISRRSTTRRTGSK